MILKEAISRTLIILNEQPDQWTTWHQFLVRWKHYTGAIFNTQLLNMRSLRDFFMRLQALNLIAVREFDEEGRFVGLEARRNQSIPLLLPTAEAG